MYLKDNHIAYTACQAISDIIQPFQAFGVRFFVYVKVYSDGSRISLNNNLLWSKFFFENYSKYVNGEIFEDKENQNKKMSYHLWTLNQANNKLLMDNESQFGIGNGIDIIVPHDDYTEFFVFASDKNNRGINNFYINNLDILKQSIFYFKDKGKDLLNQAESSGIIQVPTQNKVITNYQDINNQSILDQLQPSRYYLTGKYKNEYLTRSEYQCLKLVAKLKSAKEIANELKLSPRTVEVYINNMKEKFELHKKSDFSNVIDKFML